MAKTGKNLQRLIRAIESASAAGQPIKIESPKRIRDTITGNLREHDVVLTITHEHHDLVVAIECRDRSRPIGVDAVEAFHNKCRDTGIHSGVMVSSNGFAGTALTKANAYNIRCLSLNQVVGFDWCETTSMTSWRRTITRAGLHFLFPEGTKLENAILYDENGVALDKERVSPIALATLNNAENVPSEEGSHDIRVVQPKPAVYLMDGENRIQATACTLLMSLTVTREQIPLSFQTYSKAGTDSLITQAAIATVDVGNGKYADLVMSTQADGSIVLHVVPDSTKPE
jgi:hypothetical protein